MTDHGPTWGQGAYRGGGRGLCTRHQPGHQHQPRGMRMEPLASLHDPFGLGWLLASWWVCPSLVHPQQWCRCHGRFGDGVCFPCSAGLTPGRQSTPGLVRAHHSVLRHAEPTPLPEGARAKEPVLLAQPGCEMLATAGRARLCGLGRAFICTDGTSPLLSPHPVAFPFGSQK